MCSHARFTADQFQPQWSRARGAAWARAASSSRAVIGPAAATSARTASTTPGCSVTTLRTLPHASCAARAIRQRSSRWVAGGTKLASWAQYSTSRRGRASAARRSSPAS